MDEKLLFSRMGMDETVMPKWQNFHLAPYFEKKRWKNFLKYFRKSNYTGSL